VFNLKRFLGWKIMIPDSNVFNWIISPIGNCVKYVGDEVVNAAVLQRSIINTSNMGPLLLIAHQKFLENGKDDTGISYLIAENESLAAKAKEFIESDFDQINSHGLIGLWCAVETAVEDTVVLILMNDDKAQSVLQSHGLLTVKSSIKFPPSDNEARKVYSSLENQVRNTKKEVGKSYCHLLSVLGINISVESQILETLCEINEVRNCILHRGGIIDDKAVAKSPSLTQYLNKKIKLI